MLLIMCRLLGLSAFAGFVVLVVGWPLNNLVANRSVRIYKGLSTARDKRMGVLNELISAVKFIKFFAWESPFLKRIAEFRTKEMGYVRSLLMIRAANTALAMSSPTLASVIAFLVYAAIGHTLTPAVIFSSLSLFQLLRLPLMLLRKFS